MAPVEPPEGNGRLLKYRVDRLEHRLKGDEQAYTHIARTVNEHDRKVDVHAERLAQLHEDVQEMKEATAKVPILEERVDTLLDGFKDAKRALYAAAGAFLVLAATIAGNSLL